VASTDDNRLRLVGKIVAAEWGVIYDAMGIVWLRAGHPKNKINWCDRGKNKAYLRVFHRVLALVNEIVMELLKLDPFKNI
jgi:hypothetical protein